ncbi:MAG: DMT family transporter [Bacteroidales bacterium]
MTEKAKGHLAMFASTVVFALNVPITKSLIPQWITPLGVTSMRLTFAAVMFWIASLFFASERVERKDYRTFFLGSFFGMGFNQVLFILGLSMTSPIDATIIATLAPMMVMLISAAVLKEPITLKKSAGVVIGASGALLIILAEAAKQDAQHASSWLGNILIFCSATCYAIYLVITKPITQKYKPITLLKWMFLFAMLMVLPFTFHEILNAKLWIAYEISASWRLSYVLLMGTFVAYFLIPVALKRIRPTTVGSYNYLQPLIASLAAIFVGQDVLTWEKPVAAALVFAGVYLVTTSKSRADIERELAAKKEV